MKSLLPLIVTVFVAAIPAHAADKKTSKQDTGDKIREARAKDRQAIKDFMGPKDKNRDGSLTRAEFISDEDDKEAAGERFDEANKNGDRVLSKSEISGMLGLGEEVKKLKEAKRDKKNKK
ncbi:MAG: hypothetical protein R3242_08975 [Akkermansiaceae bacterium]|nr:hypothetical protein [Akkermansiaceae bacterium]